MKDIKDGYTRDEMFEDPYLPYEDLFEKKDESQVARNHRRRIARNRYNENSR